MTKTSLSIDVKAANSKLAIMLRRREEDEALFTIGKKKPREVKQDKTRGSLNKKWKEPPDFSFPTPLVDRPRTASGNQSFHFSVTTISKVSTPTKNGKPLSTHATTKNAQAAVDHSKYIERDGAAEHSAGAEHAGYIERPNAVESLDPTGEAAEAAERIIAALANEQPTADEDAILGRTDQDRPGIPSIFSNISDDVFEREEYWRAVHRTERNAKSHNLVLDPEASPRWWQNIATDKRVDPAFRAHALQVQEDYAQYQLKASATGNQGKTKPFVALPYPVHAERAGELLTQNFGVDGFSHSDPPVVFESGRGGRVQIRFVAELPHELTPEDRALIVQNFTDHLGSFSTDETGNKTGLMYTAVVHAPDIHNDNRNFHLHVVAHDRPAKFLEDKGLWDFEVSETYKDPGSGKDRTRYPVRQNKIGEVSRKKNASDRSTAGRDFIPAMRQEFARITNAVLIERGIDKRYDAKSYKDMGIDRTPTEHLGTRAAALEAIGVPTIIGKINAARIWNDAENAIERTVAAQADKLTKSQDALVGLTGEALAVSVDPQHRALMEIRRLLAERAAAIKDLAAERREIAIFDHLEAKAKSRAFRTRQTCDAILLDLDRNTGSSNAQILRAVATQRLRLAHVHIEKIDEEVARYRASVRDLARDVEQREARIVAIDQQLEPLRLLLEQAVDFSRKNPPAPVAKPATVAATLHAPVTKTSPETVSRPTLPGAQSVAAPGSRMAATATPLNPVTTKTTAAPAAPTPPEPATAAPATTPATTKSTAAPVPPTLAVMAPISIDGKPIVTPSIKSPPAETIDTALTPIEPIDTTSQPSRPIEPLRPQPAAPQPGDARVVVEDIAPPAPDATKAIDFPVSPAVPVQPVPASSDKVDRRRKIDEPTLFNTPEQVAPVKPGTPAHAYENWDELIKAISSERIPVYAEPNADGGVTFVVPSLNKDDRELLAAARFSHRTNNRLGSIYQNQQLEIQRLARWIATTGQDRELLILENRKASVKGVPKSINTLMENWSRAPEVIAAFRAENDRRETSDAAVQAEAKAPAANRTRSVDAKARYPRLTDIKDPLLRQFLEVVKLPYASDLDLHEHAVRVSKDYFARRELEGSGQSLQQAYDENIVPLPATSIDRDIEHSPTRGRDGQGR